MTELNEGLLCAQTRQGQTETRQGHKNFVARKLPRFKPFPADGTRCHRDCKRRNSLSLLYVNHFENGEGVTQRKCENARSLVRLWYINGNALYPSAKQYDHNELQQLPR